MAKKKGKGWTKGTYNVSIPGDKKKIAALKKTERDLTKIIDRLQKIGESAPTIASFSIEGAIVDLRRSRWVTEETRKREETLSVGVAEYRIATEKK